LDEETIETAARLTEKAATPIDDVRASKGYRREMVRVCTLRGLRAISSGAWRVGFPSQPVLLMGQRNLRRNNESLNQVHHDGKSSIVTTINGEKHSFVVSPGKNLLRLLREDAGLIGTKEGCAEGECGACTVFLDGLAVMSCLVPATRADGAEIVTIEGLARHGNLHPVQQAFIEEGAVQCGYCTPGFIMSAAKLLEEKPNPVREEIEQALTGNLCRCTGYYKILNAVERASRMEASDE
jgi:carbon-monoxide dehydrogenase medium subunit